MFETTFIFRRIGVHYIIIECVDNKDDEMECTTKRNRERDHRKRQSRRRVSSSGESFSRVIAECVCNTQEHTKFLIRSTLPFHPFNLNGGERMIHFPVGTHIHEVLFA